MGATRVHPEDIMLSKSNETRKDSHSRTPLYKLPRVVKFIETGSRMAGTRAGGGASGGRLFDGDEVSVL